MGTMSALKCEEIVELLSNYLEGTLDGELHRRCAEHLADCEGCQEYLRWLSFTIDMARALRDARAPIAFPALMEEFRRNVNPLQAPGT